MNPLSIFTYYSRHKRLALLLAAFQALAVTGLYLLVGLVNESYIAPYYTVNNAMGAFSLVQPDPGIALDPESAGKIRAHPDVERVVPQDSIAIGLPNVGGLYFSFRLIGLRQEDTAAVLEQCNAELISGEWLLPGKNGMLLSEDVAAALGLQIGDTISRSQDEDLFPAVMLPLDLVGILSSDVRLGILSYEFLEGSEIYSRQANRGLLVLARPGRIRAVDEFLSREAAGPQIEVFGPGWLEDVTRQANGSMILFFAPIILLITAAVALVVNAIHQIALSSRLPEFAALHAIGRSKRWLVRRLAWETAGLSAAGWALGAGVSAGVMAALNGALYAPKGFPFNPVQTAALLLAAFVPLAVTGLTLITVTRMFARMDTVAVVERGDWSMEGNGPRRNKNESSRPRPLAPDTFYRRHGRRAALTIGAIALMVLGVALFFFVVAAVFDVTKPGFTGLRWMSLVSSDGTDSVAELAPELETHPAVERVIPVDLVHALGLILPPMNSNNPMETYAVAAGDIPYLADLNHLTLAEGRLPEMGSNEIVIPWAAAKNRGLAVGDVLGEAGSLPYENAPVLPSGLVVTGIFAPAADPADEMWMSFMSREFLAESRGGWNAVPALLVTAKPGEKDALDAWLESGIGGEGVTIRTYGKQQAFYREILTMAYSSVSLMESIIALMAALALAGLNYIFITQRRAEFALLNALGFSHLSLTGRVMRESLFTTGIAWLAGALGCAAIVAYLQYGVYAPIGFRIDIWNPTPWLFTLPIPVAILAVGGAAVGLMFARLDPIAVIERRT
jgi:ABC-type lipoprotein release transport system permease subunit